MFKNPLPTRFRIVTEVDNGCLLCSEPDARVAVWIAVNGEVPEGKVVAHRGAVQPPTCVNPAHLVLRNEGYVTPTPSVAVDTKPKGISLCGRNARMISWKGEMRRAVDVAREEQGLTRACVYHRIKNGWDVIDAVTTPRSASGRKGHGR